MENVWNLTNERKNIQSVLDEKIQAVEYYHNQLAILKGSINSETYRKIKDQELSGTQGSETSSTLG